MRRPERGSNLDGVTFTLVATATEIAVLDAVQYLAGGPCVEGVKAERVLAYDQAELASEQDWQLFAQATNGMSVMSTLTLPVLADDAVVGSVNLYGATAEAFDGHHEAIAKIFGAWAPGAVTNADLSFRTRATAEQAPQILRDEVDLTRAWTVVAAREGIDLETARTRLAEAAARAGASQMQLARILIELAEPHDAE